jgi:5-methylcytosine-specific restriction endonuclease McrA
VQDDELCPICKRKIPDDQRDKHHLVPRVKGGRETEFMHRICHRQIHALFSEAELAQKYATIDALLQHPDLQKFVTWIQSKPVDFVDGPKRSHRRR